MVDLGLRVKNLLLGTFFEKTILNKILLQISEQDFIGYGLDWQWPFRKIINKEMKMFPFIKIQKLKRNILSKGWK